jgi:putative ABC transport system ATP-binding protein
LACLLQPDSGEVFVNDEPMSRLTESARVSIRQRQIGFISQTGRLLGSLNVLQNVAAALEIGVAPEARSRERAIEALSKVSLEAKADLRPADLSRSERHLVAIARALVRNPQILLADEATAPLDSRAGVQIGELLAGFAANNHLVVLTSRDPSWATYASRCIRIASGRIEADEELG